MIKELKMQDVLDIDKSIIIWLHMYTKEGCVGVRVEVGYKDVSY